MGDSPRYRPRSAYAQPGEIDTSLVEAESLRPRPAESRPSPLRPNPPTDPSYKALAPAGNVEPSRKGLAPTPGLFEGKPAPIRLSTDPGLSRGNSALQRGLAPPPGIA